MSKPYIVVFKDHATEAQINSYSDKVNQNGGSVTHRYGTVMKGFAAKIPDNFLNSFQAQAADIIDYIEPDGVVTTQM